MTNTTTNTTLESLCLSRWAIKLKEAGLSTFFSCHVELVWRSFCRQSKYLIQTKSFGSFALMKYLFDHLDLCHLLDLELINLNLTISCFSLPISRFTCNSSLSGAPNPSLHSSTVHFSDPDNILTMAAPTTPSIIHKMTFISCNLVTIQVGQYLAAVYPKVEPSMPVYQCPHTFQVA